MMAKKFDMGDFAKTLAQPVSESGTGREQIEYIDVDLLDGDPSNFYQLNDLDALADNIATIGLQQPVRVRDGENGHVTIVSGHRRTAAIRELVAGGRTDLRDVPCIRERDDASPALRELRLIYANSATRQLSSAEIAQQAEKVRELLYRLKEEGYEADAPYNGSIWIAAEGRVACAEVGNTQKIIRTKSAETVRTSAAYDRLANMGQRLLEVIRHNRGGANKDLAKFASQIAALCDKWDR